MSHMPKEEPRFYGAEPLGEKSHVEERIFKHLNELSYAIQHLAAEQNQGERIAYREEIQKLTREINALIPELPSAKVIDGYDCLERIEEGAKRVFLDRGDASHTHKVLDAISVAYRDFIAILNWEKEG